MKLIPLILLLAMTIPFALKAQVKIATTGSVPDSSAMLEVQSNVRGFLPPRMTTRNRLNIDKPAEGLIVFDTGEKSLYLYNGTEWEALGAAQENSSCIVVDSSGNGDFTTLSAALSALSPTANKPALIYMKPGTYKEHVTLKSYVTIRGTDATKVKIDGMSPGGGASDLPAIVMNQVVQVKLERLTIAAADEIDRVNTGVLMTNAIASFDQVFISGDFENVQPEMRTGIICNQSELSFTRGGLVEITDNSVVLNQSKGVIKDSHISAKLDHIDLRQASSVELSGSFITDGLAAVNIENGGTATVYGNTFDGVSTVVENSGTVLFVSNQVMNTDVSAAFTNYSKATISGNRFFNCRIQAIYDASNGQAIIANNLIEQSAEVGVPAISFVNSASSLIGNIFRNNTAGDMNISGLSVPVVVGSEGQISGANPVHVGLAGSGPVRLDRIGNNLVTALPGAGNVGIGIAAPTHKVHIEDAETTRGLYVDHTATTGVRYGVWARSAAISGTGVRGSALNTVGSNYGLYGEAASPSGTGVYASANATSGSNYGVQAYSASAAGRALYGHATSLSGTNYGVYGRTNSSAGYAGYFQGGRNYFQGNVGIGTNNPLVPLHIQSGTDQLRISQNEIRQSSGNLLISGKNKLSLTSDNDMELSSLSVLNLNSATDIRLGSSNLQASAVSSINLTAGTNLLLNAGSGQVRINNLVNIGAGSGMGIGTNSTPTFMLAVNGSAAKTGGGNWSIFSDARLKYDIEPLKSGMLNRLLSLKGYSFAYKNEAIEKRLALPGRQIGLLAQEVAGVFPDWVSADQEGYLYLTERGLTAIMVEAFRELRDEKDEEIEALKISNEQLAERLGKIEKLLQEQ